MYRELSLVLDGVPREAPSSRYREAIVEENLLGKATRSTRIRTAEHLTALYALDPSLTLFRLLGYFWGGGPGGEADLALLAASGRDILLRDCTDYVLAVPPRSSKPRGSPNPWESGIRRDSSPRPSTRPPRISRPPGLRRDT